jgi:hypothetical protein
MTPYDPGATRAMERNNSTTLCAAVIMRTGEPEMEAAVRRTQVHSLVIYTRRIGDRVLI